MAKLFIVESPGKLKTLRKILGRDWILEASVGHTTELASDGPKKLGFEFKDGTVLTRYVPRGPRGRQVLNKLKLAAKNAEMVYLATDPDREGEAIAWHLVQELRLKNYCRVTYTQITDSAVRKAIQNPGNLDFSLIHSQRARQCLDKLVGFEVSPLLWRTTGGKSAGRVQSATLHLICERERERLNFKPEDYWVLKSHYGEGFEAVYEPEVPAAAAVGPRVQGDSGKSPHEMDDSSQRVRSEDEAKLIAEVARSFPHILDAPEKEEESRNAPPPFITSSLQQMAGARFRYAPKKTMQIAQELYEGVGGKGLITYMRTDAVALSPEFVSEARAWLQSHSPESLPERPPFYRTKSDSQGAHEAIRPTSVDLTPERAKSLLNRDQLNLYTMIWERAVASQCKPARLSKTKITVRAAETRWVARGTVVLDPGYLKFWKNMESEKELPVLKAGQKLDFLRVETERKTTQPPPRYSEPKLVQLMEKKGIGRPSTYASTIATLKDREYVVLDKGSLAPTALGMSTDEALGKALPDLINTEFTAKMEEALDRIAEGKLAWERYLTDWNQEYLAPAIVHAKTVLKDYTAPKPGASAPALDAADQQKLDEALTRARAQGTEPICPQGHGVLMIQLSRKGILYWKCSKKSCKEFSFYRDLSDHPCPRCQKPMDKVSSSKVTGGYFLKCPKSGTTQAEDVVLFRNSQSQAWEAPGTSRPPAGPGKRKFAGGKGKRFSGKRFGSAKGKSAGFKGKDRFSRRKRKPELQNDPSGSDPDLEF